MKVSRKGKGVGHYSLQILRAPLRLYLKRKLNTNIMQNEAKDDQGPFLIVGNHVTNYDPLFALAYLKPLVRYVAASNNYDNRLKRFLFQLARVIPINKKTSDLRTIRLILKEVKEGSSIGLFPEGGRNWDGETDEIIYSTAKLIKLLKLPVYNQLLIGAYLSTPRWCKTPRKGRLDVKIYKIFTEQELEKLSDDEVFQRLKEHLTFNEYEAQRERMIPYRGEDLAEYVERLLYLCPNCNSVNTFMSEGDDFICTHCQSTGTFNEYGFIEGDFPFDNLVDFNRYQKENLAKHFEPFRELFIENVPYKQFAPDGGLKKELVNLILQKDRVIIDRFGEREEFLLSLVSQPSLTFHNTIAFFIEDTRHQFTIEPFLHHISIMYLYQTLLYLRG